MAAMMKALTRGNRTVSVVDTRSASDVFSCIIKHVRVYQQVSVGIQIAKAAYLILQLYLADHALTS